MDQDNAADSTSPKPSYRWAVSALAIILVAYGGYVFKQVGDLHELNQHELAHAVREVEQTAVSAVTTVNNSKDDNLCSFDADQPYLALDPSMKCDQAKIAGQYELKLENDGLSVKSTGTAEAAFRLQLDRILAELTFPESFRLVFLAKPSGEIVYQEAPAGRQMRRLLTWHEQNLREQTPEEGEPLTIADLSKLPDSGGGAIKFENLKAAGSRFEIALNGSRQIVYLQPVRLNGNAAGMVMGGVVARNQLFRRALEVETYSTALLAFLFLLGLAGYPFVRLISLDGRERFRHRDSFLLYLSAGSLLLLVVASVSTLDAYCRFRAAADGTLERLAEDLSGLLAVEIKETVSQLETLDKAEARPSCEELKVVKRWYERPAEAKGLDPPCGLYAEQIAWVGSDGRQLLKVMAEQHGKSQSVGHRLYVQAVRKDSLFRMEGAGTQPFFIGPSRSITDGKFYTFVSIPSHLEQKDCKADGMRKDGGRLVAALTTHLLSTERQPLPAGYGFAMINREGAVLYHSDQRSALRENLFSDLGNAAGLRSLVLARRSGRIATAYGERPHRFHVQPFRELQAGDGLTAPWFVVTFRDVSAEMATASHVFLGNGIVFVGVVLVWCFAVGAMDVVSRLSSGVARSGTWLWPQESMAGFYRLQAIVLATLLAAAVAIWSIDQRAGRVAFLAGVVAIPFLSLAVHRVTRRFGEPRQRLANPWWRRAELALLIVWLAFIPAVTLVGLTTDHEFGKLIEINRQWILQQRNDSAQALKNEIRAKAIPEGVARELAESAERQYGLALPAPFHQRPPAIGWGLTEITKKLEWLGDWLPLQTATAVWLRAQGFEVATAPSRWFSWWASAVLLALFLLANGWIELSTRRLYFALADTPEAKAIPDDQSHWRQRWEELQPDQRNLLLQISRERVANPRQHEAVKQLLDASYLKLDPDLRPMTPEFGRFLDARYSEQEPALRAWESASAGRSWHYVRTPFLAAMGLIVLFAFVSVPSLQSEVTAGLGALGGAVAGFNKLREFAGSLFSKKSGEPAKS